MPMVPSFVDLIKSALEQHILEIILQNALEWKYRKICINMLYKEIKFVHACVIEQEKNLTN